MIALAEVTKILLTLPDLDNYYGTNRNTYVTFAVAVADDDGVWRFARTVQTRSSPLAFRTTS